MISERASEYQQMRDAADCVISDGAVRAAVEQVARSIAADFVDRDPLVLCVMVGGLRFTSDLIAHLDFPLDVDYLQVSRYRDELRGGDLDWRRYPRASLRGRSVLIVDDVLDEGITLREVVRHCVDVGAADVSTAVLVDKDLPQRAITADYRALVAPNRYLFGEGMDYKGYGRNLRGIWALADS